MKTLGQFLEEAQSLGGALKNALMKPEPGSKLDRKIKAHNRSIKFGNPSGPHVMDTPPAGHRFDKKGFIRLGESAESIEEAKATYCGRCGTRHVPPSKGGTCPALKEELEAGTFGHFKHHVIGYIKNANKAAAQEEHNDDRAEDSWETSREHMKHIAKHYGKKTADAVGEHITSHKDVDTMKKLHASTLREGTIPTADEPTEHDKKMAQKVRDLLAKEKKPKKMVEAVEVSHDRYRSSHGKKASGPGAWMFTHKRSGEAKGDDTFTAPATARSFTDAAKHAKAWAKSKGHRTVYVMENTIHEEDKGIRLAKVMHKGQHVANVITYRGRGGSWVSGAETPDGQNATKKYGIGLIDTKKEIVKKIKNYHKGN